MKPLNRDTVYIIFIKILREKAISDWKTKPPVEWAQIGQNKGIGALPTDTQPR